MSDDPLDYTGRYNTALTPEQETQYQQWLQIQSALNKRDMSRDTYDYDLRGAFLGGAAQAANAHYPDTYKKPNHPSFSTGSQYHGVDGTAGGVWTQNQGTWQFVPGATNLQLHGPQRLQEYFQRADPSAVLVLSPQPTMQDYIRQQLGNPGLP